MGDTTDDLVAMARAGSPSAPNPASWTCCSRRASASRWRCSAIALNARGCRAATYTGSQAGIITDTQHGAAKITEIRPKRVLEALEAGNVVILAGFQGLSSEFEITTLGRGGSDLTAVAMARRRGRRGLRDLHRRGRRVHGRSAGRPDRAQVDADHLRRDARAGRDRREGAAVAVGRGRAAAPGAVCTCAPSFTDETGTWVQEGDDEMEGVLISGVALDADEAKVTIDDVPDRPGVAAPSSRRSRPRGSTWT